MRIAPRLSLARCTRVSNPAGKQIRLLVLFSTVAVASGVAIATGSFRGLLLRGPVVSVGGAVEALMPPVANHGVPHIGPTATLSDTQLNIARHADTATRLTDGKVLIVGGENSNGFVTPAEIFDPATGTFAVSANLNTPRADHTATRLSDGQVLIAGGRGGLGSLSSTEIFDPTSRAFTNGPNLNSARSGQSATALSDGRIVFAGGDTAGSVEIYDPQANTFSAISAHMLTPRAFHSAAVFSLVVGNQQIEKILIAGGSAPDGTPVKSGEIFDVASSTFLSVSNELTDEHISALLRVLPDGKVQIIGGTDHEDMEIYDPAPNVFGAHVHVFPIGDIHPALLQEILRAPTRVAMFHLGASSALLNRSGQTITELPASNQALVAGGVDASGNNLSSASVLNSSSASVTTDKLDYQPGTPVIVGGAGWQPHEVVTLTFHEDPHVGSENPHVFNVQADANGNFVYQEYAPEGQDAGVTYLLGAKGGTSGWSAQTAFTDTTDPVAQTLPYSQDFSALASNSTTYPAGWQGWQLSTSGSSGSFRTTAATADLALTASSSASTTVGGVHNYNGKIGILASGSSDPALALAINTTGHSNVTASFDIMTVRNPYDGGSNTRISQVDLQYRVGTSGPFASVGGNSNGVYQNNTTTQTGSGVTTPQNLQSVNLTLPSGCANQAVVQLRWVQRDFSGAGSRPSFAVDNVLVCPGVGAAGTITGSSTVCSGAMSVTYSITSVTGATTYDWSVPAGATITSGQGTTSITVNFGSSSGNVTVVPKNTCNSGTSASLVVAVNSPPNITVPPVSVSDACFGSSVNFSVTATGTSLTYQWRRNGSPLSNGGNISGADTATLTINPAGTGDAGSYDVVVSGACAPSATSDPATLTVLANSPPTVNSFTAGAAALPSAFAIDYINASTGDTLLLGATATDPNTACGDSVASFQWTINGHTTSTSTGSLSINWSTLQSTYGIVASGSGPTYPISVTAKDAFNATSSGANGTLTVYQNVSVPSLSVGAATCSQPTPFDGSASHNNDPRISIVSYTFDFGDGTSAYTETAGSLPDGAFDGKTTHTYAHAGSYNATLTVIDANGQSTPTTLLVNVTIQNNAPAVTSTGGPYITNISDNLVLNGTATDPNLACGDVLTYQWDVNGDGTFDYTGASGATTISWATLKALFGINESTLTTTQATMKLRVTDLAGASDNATTTITIYPNKVVASLVVGGATCSQPTSFDGSASKNLDPRRPIVSYTFDFGDGTPAYTETAGSFPDGLFDGKTTHTYALVGSYNATLTVIDVNGQSGQTTVPVNVTIEAPSINSQPVSVSEACPGSPVSFFVGATGTKLTYQWRRAGIPLSNGGNITGATSATLTINPVAIGDAGSYDVVLTGDCESSKTSLPATLSIDDISPMFPTPPVDHSALAGMSCEALVPDFTAGVVAGDNCTVTLTQTPTVGTSLGPGHHKVRVTATDGANNSSFFDVFFDVTDNTSPSITAPPDVVVNANGSCAATGVSLGSPIVSDNCSGVGVPTNNAPSTFPLGETTVTWSVMDAAGHTSTATQKVTVNDNANPVAVSKNVTVYLSSTAPGTVTVNATDINDGSTDNCSISQYRIKRAGANDATYSSSLTFGCGETGDQPVVLKVIDAAGNSATANATVTVVDNTPPVAQAKAISRTFGLDGMVTVSPLDINNGSTDNCAIMESKIKKAADAGFADSVTFGCGEAGAQSVTLRVKDAAGNMSTSPSTVTVNKRATMLSYTGPVTAVYGSTVTLTATLKDSAIVTGIQGRIVTFTVGTQSVIATTDSSGVAMADLMLTQSIGNYTVQAAFAGDCTFISISDSRLFGITPSCVTPIQQREYIGTLFAWTTSPTSSTATLALSAGLKACTGDIRTASVTFAIRNGSTWSPISGATNLPVGLVDPGDLRQGTATAIVQYNIGSVNAADLEVAIIVGGNYAQNDPSQDALVTITKPPAMSSITGGGETANLTDSRGFARGANGDITQFFLNVTYNKKGSNPQGKVTVIVHSMNNPYGSPALSMRTYKITSTAISVLAADTNKGTASFSSKANLQDITDPFNPFSIDGGATLQVEITDGMKGAGTNPAVGDTISIYLLNKSGGVWFANKLDANLRAVQVPVMSGTGDIIVK